ncbi:MAG: hypothetical protein RI907_2359 [Pseudomonadota bacterium]|jgi:AraC-like DNA-binding protein
MKPALHSPGRYLSILVDLVTEQGLDCGPTLAAFEVQRDVLAHPEAQLAPLQALMLFRALADLDGGSDIGLRVGKRVHFGALGEAGRAILACSDLHEALGCCAEFYPLIAPSLALEVHRHAQHTELRWVPVRPIPYDFLLVAYDMAIGGIDTMLQSVIGKDWGRSWGGYDAYFTSPAPAHASAYARLTVARAHFDVPGLPCLRLHVDNDALSTPMPLSQPGELAVLRQRLQQRLAPNPMTGHWTAWAHMMVEQANGEQPTVATLAQLVHVSPSTLTRHLRSEGTTFRDLANGIRHRKACQWLAAGQLSGTEIAQRLGYANQPSFVRAFKAMAGETPSEHARRLQRPGQAQADA